MLRYGHGLELALTVARYLNNALSVLCLDLLGETAVARVTRVVACRRVLIIAQMRVHLTFEHLLQNLSVKITQKAADVLLSAKLT